jgi:hypothetical protein
LAAAKTDIGSFQGRSERHPLPIYSLRDFDYIGGVSPSLPKFTRGALQRNKVTLRLTGRVSAFAGHFFDMSVTSHGRVEEGIDHRNAHLLSRKNERLWGSVPCRKSHLLSGKR